MRERKKVDLRERVRRLTLTPAKILEGSVPHMRRKGRLQVGMDADIVVFDLARVSDRATYTVPSATSQGMKHVVVNGLPVIRDGELVRGALPGRAGNVGRQFGAWGEGRWSGEVCVHD